MTDKELESAKEVINQILDNVEVKATVVVRDKDGNYKGEFELTSLKEE